MHRVIVRSEEKGTLWKPGESGGWEGGEASFHPALDGNGISLINSRVSRSASHLTCFLLFNLGRDR